MNLEDTSSEFAKKLFDVSRDKLNAGNQFQTAYSGLLYSCFGDTKNEKLKFTIRPGLRVRGEYYPDFLLSFIVSDWTPRLRPFFFLDLWDGNHEYTEEMLKAVDAKVRVHFEQVFEECPLPKLHGMCVIGRNIRLYSGKKGGEISTKPDALKWGVDVMSDEGLALMNEVVEYINKRYVKIKPEDGAQDARLLDYEYVIRSDPEDTL